MPSIVHNRARVYRRSLGTSALVLALALMGVGCYFDPPAGLDHDAGIQIPTDAEPNPGPDAGPSDLGHGDAEDSDRGPVDVEPGPELGPLDADAEPGDVGPTDVEPADVEPADVDAPDAPFPDLPVPDLGEPDAGDPDLGDDDAGPPLSCGDGIIDSAEDCDDGDQGDGDGCEANCTVTTGYVCIGAPSFCRLEGETAVVNQNGPSCPAGVGAGTVADPYCRVTSAVSANREYVFVYPGIYDQTVLISDRTKTLIGQGATISSPTGRGLDIRDDSEVVVRGFTIRGATDAVRIADDETVVTLEGNTIGPSGGYGVHSSTDSEVFVLRNVITGNPNGGARLDSNTRYTFINNIVHGNGTIGVSEFGGVYSRRAPSGSTFVNNTIFDNESRVGSGGMPGIRCDQATTIVNTIVWDNNTAPGTPGFVSVFCTLTYSFVGPGSGATGTNRDEDPLLLADGHLSPNSPCAEAGDPAGTTQSGGPAPTVDFDGEPRPAGALVDVGADEL